MKDTLSEALQDQEKTILGDFCARPAKPKDVLKMVEKTGTSAYDNDEEDSEEIESAEIDEDSSPADITTIDPDNELNFLGLHPNHRAQMRSRVMTAQIMRNNSVSQRFGGEE